MALLSAAPTLRTQMSVLDAKTEIEQLVLKLRACEQEKNEAQMLAKFNAEKIGWKETENAMLVQAKANELQIQQLLFEKEREGWGRPRTVVGEPVAKVQRAVNAPKDKQFKASIDSYIHRLVSSQVANHGERVHKFLDYSLLEDGENAFPNVSINFVAKLADGNEPSKTGRYRAIGISYEGQRISAARLRRLRGIVKEAYGVEYHPTQYLLLVLFDHNCPLLDSVPSVLHQILPVQPSMVSVYTEGPPTDDPILSNIKYPNEFKWMVSASRI